MLPIHKPLKPLKPGKAGKAGRPEKHDFVQANTPDSSDTSDITARFQTRIDRFEWAAIICTILFAVLILGFALNAFPSV